MPIPRAARPASPFRLLTFGGLSLVDSAGTAVSPQRRRLALLCRVSCAGELGISRDSLTACLSPESPTDSARHSLHQLLYYVRQQTREDAFIGTDPLRLNPLVITSDRDDFEAAIERGELATAVALSRGLFLDGFHLDSAEFEDWLAAERARLATKHRNALSDLATNAHHAGDYTAAIAWWRQLTSLDPLEGRAAMGLMRSLDAAGDTTGAMRHARVHTALVHAELGAGDPRVTALAAQFQSVTNDASLRPAISATATTVAGVEQESARPAPATATATVPRSRSHRRDLVFAVLGGSLVLAIGAYMARDIAPKRSPLERRVVAVMPFQMMAADSSLEQLREGMPELVTRRLAADSMTRYVNPATALRSWNRPRPDQIIDGSITGTSRHLVLTAWFRSKSDRRTSLQATAEGPLDSLGPLVDRLAGQLLGIGAGVEEFRLASMKTASLPAIRAYVRGLEERRRGRAESAREFFRDAVALDSNFALAAVSFARELLPAETFQPFAASGAGSGAFERACNLARSNQAQLSDADRVLLGITKLQWESSAEIFRMMNSAAVMYPNVPDFWYALGESFYRNGVAAGIDSAFELAVIALRRGRQIDSTAAAGAAIPMILPTIAQPTLSMVELAQIRGDTAEVRRVTTGVLAHDSSSDLAGLMRWHLAVVNGTAARREYLSRLSEITQYALTYVGVFISYTGIAGEDRPPLLDESRRRRKVRDTGNVGYAAVAIALNTGRPAQASTGPLLPSETPRGGLRSRIHEALSWGGDTTAAVNAERELRTFADGAVVAGPAAEPQFYDVCAVARWRAAHGNFAAAREASRRLHAARVSGLGEYETARFIRVTSLCAALLDAEWATGLRLPDAERRLVIADSVSRTMNAQEASFHEDASDANVLLAKLWERHGDVPRALRAARRRSGQTMRRPSYFSTLLREEGRLAALVGDTVGAIRAYRHYLVLVYDPEPSVQPEVDRVNRELAMLVREHEHIDRKVAR